MKTDIWMPIYIGDYIKDTMGLSAEQHGCYLLILMDMWTHDGWIPSNPEYLSRIARVSEERWRTHIRVALHHFFREDESVITHDRLLSELNQSKARRIKAQENGRKGGRPRTQKEPTGLPIANPTLNPERTSSPSPSHTKNSLKMKKLQIDLQPSVNGDDKVNDYLNTLPNWHYWTVRKEPWEE